jgi:hypothetical protein
VHQKGDRKTFFCLEKVVGRDYLCFQAARRTRNHHLGEMAFFLAAFPLVTRRSTASLLFRVGK